MNRSAKWIWIAEHRHAVDCYLLARRSFELSSAPASATLQITACDRYRLFVNGQRVGEGPPRSEWPNVYDDVYNLADLPFVKGRNVVAVVCHNTGLAQHGQPPGPGGLLVQLAVKSARGQSVEIVSDARWRMTIAPHYRSPGPRRFYPVGFAEVCDLRREPAGWNDVGFEDASWRQAEVVASQPAQPYAKVVPCPVPPLRLEPTRCAAVGRCGEAGSMKGITGLPFEFCVFGVRDEEFYGGTFVYSARKQKVNLDFAADNRAAVFINNRRILCQGTDDSFFNHLFYETETYTGLYYGHGHRVPTAALSLEKGWNSVGVVLGAPQETWGFVMRFSDPKTGRTLPLKFSPNRKTDEVPAWQVLSDAHLLDGCDGMLLDTPELNAGTFPTPSHLAAWEERRAKVCQGAEVLGRKGAALTLQPNTIVTLVMPAEVVGCIELEVRGQPGAVLDVTASEALNQRGYVDSLRDRLWLTDRVILSSKWSRWRSLERRGLRYLELVVRNASQPVEVRNVFVDAMHYPVPNLAEFECSDRTFNKIWTVGLATMDACTKENFEDCPIREMAQWLGDAVVEGQVSDLVWNDQALTDKALRQFGPDQTASRWMRPMVPSGFGDSLSDYVLLYPHLLWQHYMHWGDERILKDCFAAVSRIQQFAAQYVEGDRFLHNDRNPRNTIYLDHTVAKTHREMDIITGYQAVYAASLAASAEVAAVLGHKAKASAWRKQREALRRAVSEQLFDHREGLFVESRTGGQLDNRFTATTNYLVLFGQVASPEQEQQIIAKLWPSPTRERPDLWPPRENPYFKYFVLQSLFSRGLWPQAFSVLRHYYGSMLKRQDAWTFFEMFSPRDDADPKKPARTNSLCHAYGCGPLVDFFRWVCGIRPLVPGYGSVVVEPQLGDLQSLDARFHSPRGEMAVKVTGGRDGRRMIVTLPRGVKAELKRTYLRENDLLELG